VTHDVLVIAIIFSIFQLNPHTILHFVLFTKYHLHVLAFTAPSSYHFLKPSTYCQVVTMVELQSMKCIVCGFFTN